MPDLTADILVLLAAVAVLAGFIDAVAGGGGLLTIPALLVAGVPPVQAVATNKLQACFGSFTATRFFIRQGLVSPAAEWHSIAITASGAAAGALVLQWLSADFLIVIMPYALMLIALYLLLARNAGQGGKEKLSRTGFNATLVPGVGFYDGFFGPGTGTFFTLGYCQLRGMDMVRATAHAKLLNFTTNIVSLLVFIAAGKILWITGLSMAVGQALGARLGAAMAIRHGTGFIRIMTVVICVAMSISLLLKN